MSKDITIENLISTIQEKAKNKNPFIIGLSGFSGAGKSSMAKLLATHLGNTNIVSLDGFILNRLDVRSDNWQGFDWSRLVLQVLKPIKAGKKTIHYGIYNWGQNKIVENKNLDLTKYIIIEGVGLIRPELNTYFDMSVWIDIALEKAIEQGKRRDQEDYKVDHDELWNKLWAPNDRDYYNKYHPKQLADFILVN